VLFMRCMATQQQQIGIRRQDWWEPTFDPALINPLPESDWVFTNIMGAKGAFLPADTLCALGPTGGVLKYTRLTFEKCNLQGEFSHEPSILFDKCRFFDCDFSYSNWRYVTFRDCEFKNCALSLASFYECEFRDCLWENIGFSGSKTGFDRTFITNPGHLIRAGFSGTDPHSSNPTKHRRYQKYRLEGRKAHIARSLLDSHERVGDDQTFYDTAKVHDIQQIKAKWYRFLYHGLYPKKWYNIFQLSLLPAVLCERVLLQGMGAVNGWGSQLFRPLLGLILTTFVFGLIYKYVPLGEIVLNPWQKAFDISNIAGYGSQSKNEQPELLRKVEGIHLVAAILFYTVFFSTAVARNSRAR
jgi:hypothetical protein